MDGEYLKDLSCQSTIMQLTMRNLDVVTSKSFESVIAFNSGVFILALSASKL